MRWIKPTCKTKIRQEQSRMYLFMDKTHQIIWVKVKWDKDRNRMLNIIIIVIIQVKNKVYKMYKINENTTF